jgi:hypothetical protein
MLKISLFIFGGLFILFIIAGLVLFSYEVKHAQLLSPDEEF